MEYVAAVKTTQPKGPTVRTSISLSSTVNQWADQRCEEEGYENFSAYIAELIRRDYRAQHHTPAADGSPPPSKPLRAAQVSDPAVLSVPGKVNSHTSALLGVDKSCHSAGTGDTPKTPRKKPVPTAAGRA